MSSSPPSGTVTFLFTDIEGSTPLWDAFPDAMGAALARHDEILRAAIHAHDGHVFSTAGDGVGAVFGRAASAIAAAVAAQRELSAEVWVGGPVLRVRMGLHTGEAEERDGDYFGPAVNRSARIMGAANGGQVVVSDLTAGLVTQVAGVKLVDLGSIELKGVIEPVHVFGVSGDGHEWVDTPLLTGQVTRGNLPRPQTESVGDLADLQRRVANLPQASVVTLTGSGGVGKTRAAIEIGWLVVDEFVDGAWLVELAPVADPDLLATTIATALGVPLQHGSTMIESIVDWCLGRRMLLIIDNCEHVLDPVVEVVEAIVAGCPTVTIIATSREPLGVAGETVARVESLDERYAAELFVLRAKSADVGFEPTADDGDAIAAICRRLDGIPLAIELAAARIRSLSPAELLERLDDRFRLLRGGSRGGIERHQTLRATVAWSYQLLGAESQRLFDRLSVFAGSFDLTAVEAVCAGEGVDTYDIVDLLGDLVDKSMVVASRSDRGTRYRLLETLRQYGEERLDDRNETSSVRDAHLRHFVDLAQRLEPLWQSPEQAVISARFDDDWENFAAAHAWAIETRDSRLAADLAAATGYFATSTLRREHQEWLARTLELAETTGRVDARTLCGQGYWAFIDGDPDTAVARCERAVALDAPTAGMFGRLVSVMGHMGAGRSDAAADIATELRAVLPDLTDPVEFELAAFAILTAQNPETIDDDAETALAAARVTGAPKWNADVLRSASTRWYYRDPPDFERMFEDLDEAIRLHDSSGAPSVWEWMILTWARTFAGDAQAVDTMRRAVVRLYDHRHWGALAGTLEAAPILLASHAPVVAATIHGHLARSEPPWGQAGLDLRAGATAVVSSIPDNESHRARGATMDRHEIVALTLAALEAD